MATIESYQTRSGAMFYMARYRKPDNKQTMKRGFRTKRVAQVFANKVEVQKMTGGMSRRHWAASRSASWCQSGWPANSAPQRRRTTGCWNRRGASICVRAGARPRWPTLICSASKNCFAPADAGVGQHEDERAVLAGLVGQPVHVVGGQIHMPARRPAGQILHTLGGIRREPLAFHRVGENTREHPMRPQHCRGTGTVCDHAVDPCRAARARCGVSAAAPGRLGERGAARRRSRGGADQGS